MLRAMSPHDDANRELIELLRAELPLTLPLRQESEEQAQQKSTRSSEEQLASKLNKYLPR